MAHLVVALERGPRGIHPASAVALCLARDLASSRGATLTAVCEGEEAAHDALVVQAAGRYGADLLAFVGPEGLRGLHHRLAPKHVIGAATPHSLSLLRGIGRGEPTIRWIADPADGIATSASEGKAADGEILAIHAAMPPWVDLQTNLEADYEAGVDHTNLPAWLTTSSQWPRRPSAIVYAGPMATDERTSAELSLLSARAYDSSNDEESIQRGDTWLVWMGSQLPLAYQVSDGLAQIIMVPGAGVEPDSSWQHAQWVLAGRPDEAVRQLHSRIWREELAP